MECLFKCIEPPASFGEFHPFEYGEEIFIVELSLPIGSLISADILERTQGNFEILLHGGEFLGYYRVLLLFVALLPNYESSMFQEEKKVLMRVNNDIFEVIMHY